MKLAALISCVVFVSMAVAQPIDPEVVLEKYPNLSLSIRPVPGDVPIQPSQCDVYFLVGLARVYRNGKLTKKVKLNDRMDILNAKLKNAYESKDVKFIPQGIIGPELRYSAYFDGREVVLEHHLQRGSLMNGERDAQALQDLLFDLCQ